MSDDTPEQQAANFLANGGTITYNEATFASLVIQATDEATGEQWCLMFQERPRKAIILKGPRPTRAQIAEAISSSPLQALMISVADIALEYAERADR